jgi:transposase-like protein
MAKKKRHSRVEIATKLAQANGLATQGKLQSEIARTLGVSVMTLHRWRKAAAWPQPVHVAGQPDRTCGGRDRIAELQLENSRLRRLVTDLLLERIKLEEAAPRQKFSASRDETSIPTNDWVSFSKIPSGVDSHHGAASLAEASSSKTGQVAATSGTLAQCLNLEHEVHHAASKLRILGFEPLK